jgi:hypothetical protein
MIENEQVGSDDGLAARGAEGVETARTAEFTALSVTASSRSQWHR